MKNKFLTLLIILLLSFSCDFDLFRPKEKLLTQIEMNNFQIKAYLVSLGATTQDVVQIRKSTKGGNETLIEVFENYNSAILLKKDSTEVIIILEDKFKGVNTLPDTIQLKIE